MEIRPVVLLLAACIVVASCSASGQPTSSSQPPTTLTAPASPSALASTSAAALACSTTLADGETVSQTIATLVADQDAQNKALEENWVQTLGGLTSEGQDLQAAVTGFSAYADSDAPLADAAATFASDASTFLSDQSGGLLPGWSTEAGQIEQDIKTLADDCRIKFTIPTGFTV